MKTTVGFIRVRKRKTKDSSQLATYDIVRAVRLNGKPTHKYVLGLGTTCYPKSDGDVRFWMNAVYRMTEHGLSKEQRKHFAKALSRKGVRLPTKAYCKEYEGWTKEAGWWNRDKARKLRGVMALCDLLC